MLLLPANAIAYNFEMNGIYYNVINSTNNTVEVTYKIHNSSSNYYGSVTIPETVTYGGITYSVTKIGTDAFYYCRGLTSVTIPSSVTTISSCAFSECSGLTGSLVIPNSVISIGNFAFSKCSGLTSVSIPKSVKTVGQGAFWDCTGLTSVCISDIAAWCNISFVTSNSNPLYYAHALYLNNSEVSELVIPESVNVIGNYAFEYCSGLKNVYLPNSLTEIGQMAFGGCNKLANINIPNSVVYIGNSAFSGCNELTSINIPNGLSSIEFGTFSGCSKLISINIPSSVTSIGDGAFEGCSSLSSVQINDLEAWCKIQFGNGSSNPLAWGHYLFLNGQEITNLIIPKSITTINAYSFYCFHGLKKLTIHDSVTSIDKWAFYECWDMKEVSIGESVQSIGEYAFGACYDLSSVTIPKSVKKLGDYAFQGCFRMNSLTIPNSVTSIGSQAFYICSRLNTVYLVGEGAWIAGDLTVETNCSLFLDSRISSINGINIKPSNIYCYTSNPPICDDNSFADYSGTLHVPATSISTYFTAPYWCNFSNIVGDAIEPLTVSIDEDSVEVQVGNQIRINAHVNPTNSYPNNIVWKSSDETIATVNDYGLVTGISDGECDIIATCFNRQSTCHVIVKDAAIIITLDTNEAQVLPNHIISLYPTTSSIIPPEFSVNSSDPTVAAARVVNNKIQVVGIKEGTTIITVGSSDGTAIPASCLVTVYTEPGDLDCDGFINISDVTSLIDYLLRGDESQISSKNADVDGDGVINITDVTELIDILLTGN